MAKKQSHKQTQLQNKNYDQYIRIRIVLWCGIVLSVALCIFLAWFLNRKEEDQYIYNDFSRYSPIWMLIPFFVFIGGLIAQRLNTNIYVYKKCDIICYTRINGALYGRIQGNNAKRRAKATLFIDFHTGNFDHVVEAPKLLPMPVLHNEPEFLMFLAVASLFRNNRMGVDTANNFITDNKYFHKNHKKANVVYAVAFGVVRYTQKMLDGQYEAALDCLRYIPIPANRYKYQDSLVRFCKARAEHELALQAKEKSDLTKVVAYAKAAMGKYAHVGRNTGNVYLSSQAEFFRVQLHEMLNN